MEHNSTLKDEKAVNVLTSQLSGSCRNNKSVFSFLRPLTT